MSRKFVVRSHLQLTGRVAFAALLLAGVSAVQGQQAVVSGTITGPNTAVGTGAGTPAASVTGIGAISSGAARAAAGSGAAGPTGSTSGVPSPAASGTPNISAAVNNQGTPAIASGSAGARYVESCNQALERGMVNPGCQGPLYASEIARLKEEALKSSNASLLTLLGDAYQSNRSGISDVGQAYRWYLLAAVRGDPRAMQRLSELYRNGNGAPQDNVKAMGYARLAEKLSPPGTPGAQLATEAIRSLGQDMAAEEVGLAERFAGELELGLKTPNASMSSPQPTGSQTAAAGSAPLSGRLPGMGAARLALPAAVSPPSTAGTTLPGSGNR